VTAWDAGLVYFHLITERHVVKTGVGTKTKVLIVDRW